MNIMRNILAFLVIFDFFFFVSFVCKMMFEDIQWWILAYFVIVFTAIFYVAYVVFMRGRKV